jgi:hypothetical protein
MINELQTNKVEEDETDRTCSTPRREEECIESLEGRRPRRRWEVYITMYLRGIRLEGVLTGFIRIGFGTSDVLL